MTLATERLNALVRTRELLLELVVANQRLGVPAAISRQAKVLLRHYPSEGLLKDIADRVPTLLLAEQSEHVKTAKVAAQTLPREEYPEIDVRAVFAEFAEALAAEVTSFAVELVAQGKSTKASVRHIRELVLRIFVQKFEALYLSNDEAAHRRRVLLVHLLSTFELHGVEAAVGRTSSDGSEVGSVVQSARKARRR